ncbi:hypothetical protein D9M70_546900 [compost metagenome]
MCMLGNTQIQHPVPQLSVDLGGIQLGAQGEGSPESRELDFGIDGLQLSGHLWHDLPFQQKRVTFHIDHEALLGYARKVRKHLDSVVIFEDIDTRQQCLGFSLAAHDRLLVVHGDTSFKPMLLLNGYAPGLRSLPPRQRDAQNAVAIVSLGLVGIDLIVEAHGALEASGIPLVGVHGAIAFLRAARGSALAGYR